MGSSTAAVRKGKNRGEGDNLLTPCKEMNEANKGGYDLLPVVTVGDEILTEEEKLLDSKTKVVSLTASKTLIYGMLSRDNEGNERTV